MKLQNNWEELIGVMDNVINKENESLKSNNKDTTESAQANNSAENLMKVINQLQGNFDTATIKKLTNNISNYSKSIIEIIETMSVSIKEVTGLDEDSRASLSMLIERLSQAAKTVEDIANSPQSQNKIVEKLNHLTKKIKI